jgi:alkaline phosphatase D
MNVQTRRQFVVRAGTVAASAILSPSALAAGLGSARPAALARGGRFSEGVMSGEPTPSAITLWTRLADAEGKVSLDLEVATDKSFRHVVAHKRLPTSAAVNHNVKTRITGLKAHEQYYYRFATATKDGPVGRFRTALPADSLQPVRFAFWSCQDYTHGYYNAHEAMAR